MILPTSKNAIKLSRYHNTSIARLVFHFSNRIISIDHNTILLFFKSNDSFSHIFLVYLRFLLLFDLFLLKIKYRIK